MITTIYRRDGSVLFRSATATTTAQAVNELVAEARAEARADLRNADLGSANLRYADLRNADLGSANLRYADLRYADLRYADLRNARGLGDFFQLGPIDTWWMSATIEPNGWIFRAGCHRFTEAEAREWWRPENLPAWTKGSAPDHGARMLAGVDALIALAKAHNWPEKLEEENPE